MSLGAAILALVIGILLIVWTAHIVLTVLGWVLVAAGAFWLFQYLTSNRNRSDQ